MIAVMTAIAHPRVRAAGIQPSGISSRSAGAGSPHPLAWDPDYPGTHMWEAPPGGPHRPFGQGARQPHLTSEHAHPGLPSRQARFGTLGCLLDSQGIHKPASATSGSETIAAAIEQTEQRRPGPRQPTVHRQPVVSWGRGSAQAGCRFRTNSAARSSGTGFRFCARGSRAAPALPEPRGGLFPAARGRCWHPASLPKRSPGCVPAASM